MNTQHKFTVLLLEKHQACRRATLSLLSAYGYACIATNSAAETVKLAEKHPRSVVLADFSFDDDSGLILIKCLRSTTDAHIIIMSSSDGDQIQQPCRDAGAHHFLSKPYDPEVLLDILSRYSN